MDYESVASHRRSPASLTLRSKLKILFHAKKVIVMKIVLPVTGRGPDLSESHDLRHLERASLPHHHVELAARMIESRVPWKSWT